MTKFQLIGPTKIDDMPDLLAVRAERLAPYVRRHEDLAEEYVATDALRMAVNVALSLGRPLLLTGEPGSGKTLAAWWIAARLGLNTENMHEFHVKSDSRARDLCYEFDAVSWYRESQLMAARQERGSVPKDRFLKPGPLGHAFGWNGIPPTKPSVILIDEIDKAPRDFPNDLLLELDQMRFTIAETGNRIACPPNMRPVIIITSNAERRLPDPFLRRCIIHNIVLDEVTVQKILAERLAALGDSSADLVRAAAQFLVSLPTLNRKPSLEEFWKWLSLAVRFGDKPASFLTASLRDRKNLTELPFVQTILSPQDLALFGD